MKSKRVSSIAVPGVGLVLLLAFVLAGFADKGGLNPGGQDFAVSFSFRDALGDRIQSEVPGSQQPYSSGMKITNDPAALQMNGGGSFYFNFADEASCPADGCRNPFGPPGVEGIVQTSFAVSECSLYPLNSMSSGQNQLCAFKPNPSDPEGDERWRLRFDPTPTIGGDDPDERSGTRVTVTCVTSSPSCTEWTLEATGTDIGSLLRVPEKGRLVETWQGSYSMPFRMTVTKK